LQPNTANCRKRFKHILVDEFQDTNIAQLELLHLLSGERRNIVVVGDNDQAIYRFPRRLLRLASNFSASVSPAGKKAKTQRRIVWP